MEPNKQSEQTSDLAKFIEELRQIFGERGENGDPIILFTELGMKRINHLLNLNAPLDKNRILMSTGKDADQSYDSLQKELADLKAENEKLKTDLAVRTISSVEHIPEVRAAAFQIADDLLKDELATLRQSHDELKTVWIPYYKGIAERATRVLRTAHKIEFFPGKDRAEDLEFFKTFKSEGGQRDAEKLLGKKEEK